LLWFNLIRHLSYDCEIRSKCDCKLAVTVIGFSCIDITVLSSV